MHKTKQITREFYNEILAAKNEAGSYARLATLTGVEASTINKIINRVNTRIQAKTYNKLNLYLNKQTVSPPKPHDTSVNGVRLAKIVRALAHKLIDEADLEAVVEFVERTNK